MTAGATPGQRTRRDIEGLSREDMAAQARRVAEGMRRDGRSCSRFERWLHVLDLHHRDPQLLTEVVLVLTDPPTTGEEVPTA